MNERPSEPENDDVRQAYRALPDDAVPPELDARVLDAARTALERRRAPKWLRWSGPIALAASVLVVVAVVMDPSARKAANVSDALEMHKTSSPMRQDSAEADAPEPRLEDGAGERSAAQTPAHAPAAPAAASPPPAEPASRALGRNVQPAKPIVSDMASEDGAPQSKASESARDQRARNDSSFAMKEEASRETQQERRTEGQAEEKAAAADSTGASVRDKEVPRGAPPATAITTTATQRAIAPPPSAAPSRHPPLAEWLHQIAELQASGDHEQAKKEIAALQRTYPEVDVEKELAAIRQRNPQR